MKLDIIIVCVILVGDLAEILKMFGGDLAGFGGDLAEIWRRFGGDLAEIAIPLTKPKKQYRIT